MDKHLFPENIVNGKSLDQVNAELEGLDPARRIQWALEHLPASHILSSSFGIQSAVLLHMVTLVKADIPVLLIDTGYLFPETYLFIEQLTERLKLNLQVYRANKTPAWQEASFGFLWEKGLEGIEKYNYINKVEPMQKALKELHVGTWFAGLRREQSDSRAGIDVLRMQEGRFKVHPIVDWRNRDVHLYLKRHDLPYHPLWDKGYMSVGDVHTSQPLLPGMTIEETRFMGLKRECGLHE